MKKCIFCAISKHLSSTKLEYEDNNIVAFYDINPKAKIHLLIIPKKHIESVTKIDTSDSFLIGEMIMVAQKLAVKTGISDDGYRLIFNVGKNSGQIVDHIHLHLLGGEKIGDMIK